MGLNGELKYIFIQLKIIFILTQHSFIKKIFKIRGGGMHTAAMQKTQMHTEEDPVCVSEQYACLFFCLLSHCM